VTSQERPMTAVAQVATLDFSRPCPICEPASGPQQCGNGSLGARARWAKRLVLPLCEVRGGAHGMERSSVVDGPEMVPEPSPR